MELTVCVNIDNLLATSGIDRFRSMSRDCTLVFLEIWTNPENRQMKEKVRDNENSRKITINNQ